MCLNAHFDICPWSRVGEHSRVDCCNRMHHKMARSGMDRWSPLSKASSCPGVRHARPANEGLRVSKLYQWQAPARPQTFWRKSWMFFSTASLTGNPRGPSSLRGGASDRKHGELVARSTEQAFSLGYAIPWWAMVRLQRLQAGHS